MQKRIRVAALTSGRHIPSARFRVRQHIASLGAVGIDVRDYVPCISQHARLPGALGRIRQRYLLPLAAGQVLLNAGLRVPGIVGSHRADVTWIERNFVPGFEDIARSAGRPRVLDVDDAIWLSTIFGESTTRKLARSVDAVVAGNAYLANWYSQYCDTVHVVPTAVDCSRFAPKETQPGARPAKNDFVIGWTGTSGNFRYLHSIERPLSDFLKAHADARLRIVAERRPELDIPQEQFDFVPWTPENEASSLQEMAVGLMPLADDPWTRGKCSYKMLQYMATGLPVIASPVGMNADVLKMGNLGMPATSESDWSEALALLHGDPDLRSEFGCKGREIALSTFDLPVVAGQLATIFRQLAP